MAPYHFRQGISWLSHPSKLVSQQVHWIRNIGMATLKTLLRQLAGRLGMCGRGQCDSKILCACVRGFEVGGKSDALCVKSVIGKWSV